MDREGDGDGNPASCTRACGPRCRGSALRGGQPPDGRGAQKVLDLPGSGVTVGDLQRFVDRTNPDRKLVVGHRERRRDEEHVPAAEDVDVALEQSGLERVRERARRTVPALEHLLRTAILHELDTGEEPAPADVADRVVAIRNSVELREELLPHPRRAIDKPVLAVRLDRSNTGRAREGMPAVRRADPEHVSVEVVAILSLTIAPPRGT